MSEELLVTLRRVNDRWGVKCELCWRTRARSVADFSAGPNAFEALQLVGKHCQQEHPEMMHHLNREMFNASIRFRNESDSVKIYRESPSPAY